MANTLKNKAKKTKTTKTTRKTVANRSSIKRPAPKSSPTEPYLTTRPSGFDLSAKKFELSPANSQAQVPSTPAYEYLGELPDSYGTKKLFLVSRDPQWAFAYWDLTWQQYQDASRAAHDGKVFLHLYSAGGERLQQIQIWENSRSWYLHVNRPGESLYSELGYYQHDGNFYVISRSNKIESPRDSVSWKTESRFVTIPFHYSFQQLRDLIRGQLRDGEGLAEALARLQEEGFEFPFSVGKRKPLTEGQHDALMQYLAEGDLVRRVQMGSAEITEILRRRFEEMQSSGQWMSSQSVTSLSSAFGGGARERNFHMHVNAELIIYGGTDPKASVRIDGKAITLREDGTFSYHFALPDGDFHIPIEATSPDHVETRSAMLSFVRMTETSGDVRATGQPPLPEPIGRVE